MSHIPPSTLPTSTSIEDRAERILTHLTALRHTNQTNIAGYETLIESLKHHINQLVQEKSALSERVLELEISEAGRKEVERERDEVVKAKEEVEREMVSMEAREREMQMEIDALKMENEVLRREIGERVEADSGSSNVEKLKRTSSVWKRLSRA